MIKGVNNQEYTILNEYTANNRAPKNMKEKLIL